MSSNQPDGMAGHDPSAAKKTVDEDLALQKEQCYCPEFLESITVAAIYEGERSEHQQKLQKAHAICYKRMCVVFNECKQGDRVSRDAGGLVFTVIPDGE